MCERTCQITTFKSFLPLAEPFPNENVAELESFWLELAEPKAKSEGVCDAGLAKSNEAAESDFPPFSEPFDGFFKKSKLAAASGSGAAPEVVLPNPAKPANRLGPPS